MTWMNAMSSEIEIEKEMESEIDVMVILELRTGDQDVVGTKAREEDDYHAVHDLI
jgi:hypothetical protein